MEAEGKRCVEIVRFNRLIKRRAALDRVRRGGDWRGRAYCAARAVSSSITASNKAVLAAWPEPLPVPCRAPALAWRYLIFLRTACDALEAAYSQVWQQGWSTHCPLTEVPDTHFAPRPPRPPRDRLPPSSEGLGALVIGARLPEAGQQCLYEALAAGVDWVHPAAFWRELGIAPDPDPIRRDAPGPGGTPSTVQQEPVPPAAVVPAPAMAMAMAMAPPAEATPAIAVAMDDPLAAITRATLAAWIAHPRFNRHNGEGWWTGELYVAAWRPNRLPRPCKPMTRWSRNRNRATASGSIACWTSGI